MFQDFVKLSLKSKKLILNFSMNCCLLFIQSRHSMVFSEVFYLDTLNKKIYSMYFKITSVYRPYLLASRCLWFQINTNLKENNEKSDFQNMLESKIQICICLDLTDFARFFGRQDSLD